MRYCLTCIVIAAFTSMLSEPTAAQVPPDIDSYVEEVCETFDVPGVAVSIVKDGEVVVAKGYGVRRLGEETPVDEHTLFGIASNTKAFTATAIGMLVEEGKLDWDKPVIEYLPWFRLSDPYVTGELTVRDLLVHRSGLGLGAGDLLWWPETTYDRKEIVRRLRYLPLATSFRSAYAYDNVLYIAAGEVIEAVSGETWEQFILHRILEPAGMEDARFRNKEIHKEANVAAAHARVEGTLQEIQPFTSDKTNASGGIYASASDMAQWLIAQLDSGRVGTGRRLFSPHTTAELWTLVTPMPVNVPSPELAALRSNFTGYALGFRVQDYRGYKLVNHTGGNPGFVSKVSMIPDLKLGIAVLTNQESTEAFEAITYQILDYYLDSSDTGWIAAFDQDRKRRAAATESAYEQAGLSRDITTGPSLHLSAYTGEYSDRWYGNMSVRLENGGLVLRFAHTPALVGDLEHWQHDTFIVRWRDRTLRADAFVTFGLDHEGNIDSVKMKAVSPETDFSFDFHDLQFRPVTP